MMEENISNKLNFNYVLFLMKNSGYLIHAQVVVKKFQTYLGSNIFEFYTLRLHLVGCKNVVTRYLIFAILKSLKIYFEL